MDPHSNQTFLSDDDDTMAGVYNAWSKCRFFSVHQLVWAHWSYTTAVSIYTSATIEPVDVFAFCITM